MYIDSHCHLDRLNLDDYDGDLNNALNSARENGVDYFLCVCIDLEHFSDILNIAKQHPDVSASVGVHPCDTEGKEPTVDELVRLSKSDQIIAIGETGLDYFYNKGDLTWQRDRFRNHINAAKISKKPLIIHSRDAKDDTIKILTQESANEVGGVMHCFVEDWDIAQKSMDLNFYISFSGIVTFKNAAQIQNVAQKMPLDRMLIETDSPYLAPIPHRGKSNYPKNVIHVAEFIADLRNTTVEDIAQATSDNFHTLFTP
ncbi:MAG: TatD family hydrolase [Gammaproteobacteria bacterium]